MLKFPTDISNVAYCPALLNLILAVRFAKGQTQLREDSQVSEARKHVKGVICRLAAYRMSKTECFLHIERDKSIISLYPTTNEITKEI